MLDYCLTITAEKVNQLRQKMKNTPLFKLASLFLKKPITAALSIRPQRHAS